MFLVMSTLIETSNSNYTQNISAAITLLARDFKIVAATDLKAPIEISLQSKLPAVVSGESPHDHFEPEFAKASRLRWSSGLWITAGSLARDNSWHRIFSCHKYSDEVAYQYLERFFAITSNKGSLQYHQTAGPSQWSETFTHSPRVRGSHVPKPIAEIISNIGIKIRIELQFVLRSPSEQPRSAKLKHGLH